jgi:vacuolar-type H+-ATPase subunit F/Vma7
MIYTQEVPLVLEVPSLGDKPGAESADDLLKGAIGISL